MDFLIALLICPPITALGVALVRDYRGLRTFLQRGSTEERYEGPALLVGWLCVILPLYPVIGESIKLVW